MATYSNRIRELRTARGMSQEKLADILGVTKQAVSQYERGVRWRSFSTGQKNNPRHRLLS